MACVILLEADRLLAGNIQDYLKQAGHDVSWHVDPQSAIDNADQKRPDAIVLDLLLSNRSGIEFLYELRSYPEWVDLPVIVFSSVPAAEFKASEEAQHQLNIFAYHYKPQSSLADLANSLNLCLQKVPA